MAETTRIEIPAPMIEHVVLRLVGVTPYLANAFPDVVLRGLEAKGQKKATSPKTILPPEQQFENAIHRDRDGQAVIPAASFHNAMVSAGQRFAGAVGTELRGVFSLRAEWLPVKGPDPVMHRTMARAKGVGRTPMPRYRALFDPWMVECPFSYNADYLSLEQLVNLAVLAGEMVGVGDWRKELKGGTGAFGMFTVEASDLGTGR